VQAIKVENLKKSFKNLKVSATFVFLCLCYAVGNDPVPYFRMKVGKGREFQGGDGMKGKKE